MTTAEHWRARLAALDAVLEDLSPAEAESVQARLIGALVTQVDDQQ